MVTMRITWDHASTFIFENEGWDALVAWAAKNPNMDLNFETKSFNTTAEALAYDQGVADSNGWDSPMTQIL